MTSTNPAQFEFTYEFDSDAETDEWLTLGDLAAPAMDTRKRQQDRVFTLVEDAGTTGLTVWELRHDTGLHHGVASGALSNLHKAGKIVRTANLRGGYSIYTTPENLAGRAVVQQGRKAKPCPNCGC